MLRRTGLPRPPKACTLPGIAHNPTAPAAPLEQDLRFLDEQVGRYVTSRAWEGLGNGTLHLDLKVGSWYEASAQAFAKGAMNVLFLFPGRRDLRALQQAGLGEPPAGTIFAELGGGTPAFKIITPEGWLPLERRETQVLALALAAITHLDASGVEPEASGDLTMPGGARGRYRVRLAPPDPDADQLVPVFGIARDDLYGDGEGECTLSMVNLGWADYEVLRQRARVCVKAPEPFRDTGDAFPLVVLSGTADLAHEVAGKLQAAVPLGIAFSEKEGVLAMMLAGRQDNYLLMEFDAEREQVLLWWHQVRTDSGAYAVVVTDNAPDASGRWDPTTVAAVFEFGRQTSG
jgi:hypothetical protein